MGYIVGHGMRGKAGWRPPKPVRPAVNPSGMCMCGCGQPAPLAPASDAKKGLVIGEPQRFVHGHHLRGKYGADNPAWRGGASVITHKGYVVRFGQYGHPHASGRQARVEEHIDKAYRALGKPLPPRAEVHHVNGDRADNRNSNLVVCEDHGYHMLLHYRSRALKATGDPNAAYCVICKQWDVSKVGMYKTSTGSFKHTACATIQRRQYKLAAKAKEVAR